MKWYSCKDKSITPPLNKDLLLAHRASHFPDVDLARWSGEEWYDPQDRSYYYRDHEVEYWANWPEHPDKSEYRYSKGGITLG